MHTPETDPVVPPVDAADDDVGGDRRGVGVAIAEEPGEEGAEVFGVEVFGAEDDFLARWGDGVHLGAPFLGLLGKWGEAQGRLAGWG